MSNDPPDTEFRPDEIETVDGSLDTSSNRDETDTSDSYSDTGSSNVETSDRSSETGSNNDEICYAYDVETSSSDYSPFYDSVSLEKAMSMLRQGRHVLLVWNVCFGGGPDLSKEGHELSVKLQQEGFDSHPDVILMEVLRRLGPSKAAGRFSAFALGLVEKELKKYLKTTEYDGWQRVGFDNRRYVEDKLMAHLDRNGAITKEEYLVLVERSESVGIIDVELGY